MEVMLSQAKKCQRLSGTCQKPEERQGTDFPPMGSTKPADTWILDFSSPELGENTFYCVSYLVWGTLLWQSQQTTVSG